MSNAAQEKFLNYNFNKDNNWRSYVESITPTPNEK